MENRPLYHKLYADMIHEKYPEKASLCNSYLKKERWTALDVMYINQLLFGKKKDQEKIAIDQKHRAYDRDSIREILIEQVKNKLNNTQIANKYGLSRNTVAKWRKLFPELTQER